MKLTSIYLSRILGNKIFTEDDNFIGKLKDLIVTQDQQNPKVVAVLVGTPNGDKYLSWNTFSIRKYEGQYILTCSKQEEVSIDDLMFLKKHVLDMQIIDIDGRKVERVNDIRLALLDSGFFVIAVDIGAEGLLRRLGVAKPLKKIGVKITSKFLLWEDIETIFSSRDIKLSKTYDKLDTLHPSDLADIIEDLDVKTGSIIFSSLDNDRAADVMEEFEEDVQIKLLSNLSVDRAADVLEEMPADEAADILEELDEEKAEELLNNMDKETSDDVRELMKYDEDEVGNVMSADFISFVSDYTVGQVISDLREKKPSEDEMHTFYIVDKELKLIGTVGLREIVIGDAEQKLEAIMNKDFLFVHDNDNINELVKKVSKYNLASIPVVDNNMVMVGNVIINDIVYELLKTRKRIV